MTHDYRAQMVHWPSGVFTDPRFSSLNVSCDLFLVFLSLTLVAIPTGEHIPMRPSTGFLPRVFRRTGENGHTRDMSETN